MSHILTVNDMTIPYEIIRSKRKTYGISVSAGGKVTVRIPLQGSERFAVSMAEEKKEWIAKNVSKMMTVKPSLPQKEKTPCQKRLEAPYRQAAKEYIPKRAAHLQPSWVLLTKILPSAIRKPAGEAVPLRERCLLTGV